MNEDYDRVRDRDQDRDAARDMREMILRKIDKLSDDVGEVRTLVAGTNATTTGLANSITDVRVELADARKRYHENFNKMHEFFADDDEQLEALRLRVTTLEQKITFIYKCAAGIATVLMSIFASVFAWLMSSGQYITKLFGK